MIRLHRAGRFAGRLQLSLRDGLQDWNKDVPGRGAPEGSQDTNSQKGLSLQLLEILSCSGLSEHCLFGERIFIVMQDI